MLPSIFFQKQVFLKEYITIKMGIIQYIHAIINTPIVNTTGYIGVLAGQNDLKWPLVGRSLTPRFTNAFFSSI